MGNSQDIIRILEIVLLIVGILVGGRVFLLLGNIRDTLNGVNATRAEISSTLKRVEAVADETKHVLKEELAPTLQAARVSLANVEITTRALSETVLIARKAAGAVEDAQRFFSSSGPIAQAILKKASGVAGGLLSGFSQGLKSVLGKGGGAPPARTKIAPQTEPKLAIPGTDTTNPVLHADTKETAEAKVRKKR